MWRHPGDTSGRAAKHVKDFSWIHVQMSSISSHFPSANTLSLQLTSYAFFWAIPRRLNFICRYFGTLCLFDLYRPTCLRRWDSVPKCRHIKFRRQRITQKKSGFGDLEVACWPLVPKFAGSNPAEAIGFLRANKNPQHAFLRWGSKAVGPTS